MPLRKKTIKVSNSKEKENDTRIGSILSRKTRQSEQAYIKPLYSQSQVDLRPLPSLRPSSPLLSSTIFTPLNDSPSSRRRKAHRRSRSFSALSPSKTLASGLNASPSLRGSNVAFTDPFANLDGGRDLVAAQPWRSQETWQALHSTSLKPNVVRAGLGEAGWRGNGAFFAGSQTNLAAVKSVYRAQHKEDQTPSSRVSRISINSPVIPKRTSSLRLRQSATISISSRHTSKTSTEGDSGDSDNSCPSPLSPSRRTSEHTITSSEETHHYVCTPISESPDPYRVPTIVAPSTPRRSSGEDDEDALLPPLTPKFILKSPLRSSSFATLPTATPIPWGRRGSSPNTPATPQTPIPRSQSVSASVARKSTAPSRPLPRPPPDVPNSPELDFGSFKPVFPTGQSSQKLQAAIEASRAIPRSTSQSSMRRGRDRSGSVLTQESGESHGSSPSASASVIMTPRTALAPLLPVSTVYDSSSGDDDVAPLVSPNKRAGMMFTHTPSPRKNSLGRGLSSAGSSMSLASVKSVERGGWL